MTSNTPTELDRDLLLRLYRQMQLIRQCEEQLAQAHQQKWVHGACHTYIGQEAIAAGVCAHLRPDDTIFSAHRGHGHALAKGLEPRELFAELYGRATGCSGGRGGSMHLFAPEIGLMGTSGIVGAAILQAAGAGYSFRLLKADRVALAFFGDGAVNNGVFHEGLNLAGIWELPVLFVCENNQFATEIPFHSITGNPSVAARGAMYGLPGYEVDGNDVIAIHELAGEAIRRARRGEGATLIECKTYRTRPHAEGMTDFTYRSREEVEDWKTRCPIDRLRQRLLQNTDARSLEAIDAEVAQVVAEARAFAEVSPWPDPRTVTRHVYEETAKERVPAQPASAPRTAGRQLTFVQATREALAEEMARNPALFVLGEGIGRRGGNFKTTEGLFALYGPERLRDTPICERGFVGLACGAAMTGARPVVDFMFADFLFDAAGEILNQIAKIRYMSSGRIPMPLLLRGCIGIGHSTGPHHSANAYPMYAHFPGLRVVVPSTPHDAKGLFRRALNCQDPVLFLEHRELLNVSGPVPEGEYEIEFGSAAVVREGRDLTVVALARMVWQTLAAADRLAGKGIALEVIDPRTVSPLDSETILRSVHKTGRLLIVDEAYAPFGLGAEVAAQVSADGFADLRAPIRRLHGAFVPTPYSPPLEHAVVPQVEDIERAVHELLQMA